MRKYLAVLLCLALGILVASSAMAFTGSYTPGAGINGTVHDLGASNQGAHGMAYLATPADGLNRICIFCHAPHNTYRLNGVAAGLGPTAAAAYDYLPLWNHTLEAAPSFTMYTNGAGAPTLGHEASQAILTGMTPGSTSLLCLSCHDGNVAVNSWGNANQKTQSTGSTIMATGYQIGTGGYLGNHHPIGFNYDNVQAGDIEIRSADTAMLTPTTFVRDHLYGAGNTNMECGTCHAVHNKGNGGETLLWRSDANSQLCLTCHDKGTYTAP